MISPITAKFLSRVPSHHINVVPEVSAPDSGYHMFHSDRWEADGGSVEVETAEFLYGLVRVMRPAFVVETGTHAGISAAYMGMACADNEFGHVASVEINYIWVMRADRLHGSLGEDVFNRIQVAHASSLNWARRFKNRTLSPDQDIDLLFLDSEPDLRYKELELFWDRVKPGGIIIIHDNHSNMSWAPQPNPDHPHLGNYWPFGDFKPTIGQLVKENKLHNVHFSTPRGCSLYYKVNPEQDVIDKWLSGRYENL